MKIKPSYISSNVIPNILSPYDKIIDRQNAITGLSDIYMTSNGINNLYISSNNFYRGSNINLEKQVQILTTSNSFNSYLIIGDGGRLSINGKYGTLPTFQACTTIGVGDYSETNGGLKNTSINLYENGNIQYYGCALSGFCHNFVGNSYMPSLNIASMTNPLPANILLNIGSGITANTSGNMTMNTLTVNDSITAAGVISGSSIVATNIYGSNITVKTPIKFTTSRIISVNEGSSSANYYLYDIDLTKYTKKILLGARNYRQFRVRTWEADGDFENIAYVAQNNYNIFMSDYNGLSIRAYNDYFVNQDLSRLDVIFSHTLVRNTFNYLSYASRLAPATVYMIIEDLL